MKELTDGEPQLTERGSSAEDPLTVLVVGADLARATDLLPHVRAAGFPAEVAAPDAAAFDRALASPPALLIADIGERDVATLRFADRLRQTLGSLAPAVIAIVEGDETSFERAFVYGAKDVLSRPVTPSLLRVQVARHIRRPSPGIVGGYRILRVLGRGGMGTVYLAQCPPAARVASGAAPAPPELAALKVLETPSTGLDAESVARFRRECAALRALTAPGIPRFLEAGRDGDAFFCAMEYVAGETLARALERGPLTDLEVARIVDEVGEALEEIHALGLIHRDVKPGNVIRGRDGRHRLVDFGLARAKDDWALTRPSEVLGTVAYMAPELIRGEPIGDAADAFALGMTAFEAALGASPLEGSTYDVASRIAQGKVPRAGERLAGAASELVAALDGLLAADPRARMPIAEARAKVKSLTSSRRSGS